MVGPIIMVNNLVQLNLCVPLDSCSCISKHTSLFKGSL